MDVNSFQSLNFKYDALFKKDLKKGKLPMRSTDFGFWGAASLFTLFEFFQKIGLNKYKNFLDLGSGDGRVVLLASLFTKATGIEGDEELVNFSRSVQKELGLKAEFHLDNYMKHDFSEYDFIFIYPDKGFSPEFEEKLNRELKGDFYVYNEIYKPYGLDKRNTVWVDQMPITLYKRK